MTSESAEALQKMADEYASLRERMDPVVRERVRVLVVERFPTATGVEIVSDVDDAEQYVSAVTVLTPEREIDVEEYENQEWYDEWKDELDTTVDWLTFTAPGDYTHGASIDWE